MCDPVSIGLTLAGTAMQGIAQGQVASAQKKDINAAGQQYDNYVSTTQAEREAELARQNSFYNQKKATVADTLADYSRPNQDQLLADATAKRQSDYVSPLANMSFAAPTPATGQSSAVAARNATTAGAAKAQSIGEAIAKANLDAYGDANLASSARAANNAANLDITSQAATNSQNAENVYQNLFDQSEQRQQAALQPKLDADKGAGAVVGGLGDLFTAAGMLGAGGAGASSSLFGSTLAPFTAANPGNVAIHSAGLFA